MRHEREGSWRAGLPYAAFGRDLALARTLQVEQAENYTFIAQNKIQATPLQFKGPIFVYQYSRAAT